MLKIETAPVGVGEGADGDPSAHRLPGDMLPSQLGPLDGAFYGDDVPMVLDLSQAESVPGVQQHNPRRPPFRPSDLGRFDAPNPAELAMQNMMLDFRLSAVEKCLTNYTKRGGVIGRFGRSR